MLSRWTYVFLNGQKMLLKYCKNNTELSDSEQSRVLRTFQSMKTFDGHAKCPSK